MSYDSFKTQLIYERKSPDEEITYKFEKKKCWSGLYRSRKGGGAILFCSAADEVRLVEETENTEELQDLWEQVLNQMAS